MREKKVDGFSRELGESEGVAFSPPAPSVVAQREMFARASVVVSASCGGDFCRFRLSVCISTECFFFFPLLYLSFPLIFPPYARKKARKEDFPFRGLLEFVAALLTGDACM